MTPFKLIYGKSCHLPVELEHKACWAIRNLNLDPNLASERRKFQLNELEELRINTYENSRIYKERTKRWHDKKILKTHFKSGDLVLLFNSRLKLFLGKLRSRWSGPFQVCKVYPYGAIDIFSEDTGPFTVSRQRHEKMQEKLKIQQPNRWHGPCLIWHGRACFQHINERKLAGSWHDSCLSWHGRANLTGLQG